MNPKLFFTALKKISQKQYEALRALYLEGKSPKEVAKKFGYTLNSIYSLARDFRKKLESGQAYSNIFVEEKPGRKAIAQDDEIYLLIVQLRKKYLSVDDIKSCLDALNKIVSIQFIHDVLKKERFSRLPRRTKKIREETRSNIADIKAMKSMLLQGSNESFYSSQVGILCFLLYINKLGIDKLIEKSDYPGTKTIPKINSILCFLALKLSNVRRYSSDDIWCMDRGIGLFAGLNVLPKAAWFSSYSHRVTREMNMKFLKGLNQLWFEHGLLSDTANLDFTTVPYWGDDNQHLEKHWSGTRHQAIKSILAALVHDPDSGIITYGDTTSRNNSKDNVAVEFLDFYKESGGNIRYLVFDSKFTTYENLRKLEDDQIKFLTIRRRGSNIIKKLNELPESSWITYTVPSSNGPRRVKAYEEKILPKRYGKELRQIAIKGNRIKPALIITNDFDLKIEEVVRKYARRWLIEKGISEQVYFFHLNRVSSSMVIKVDFDLTMTILAHNLYKMLALDLSGFEKHTDVKLYEKFIENSGEVEIFDGEIKVKLKKKRNLPALLTAINQFKDCNMAWLNASIKIESATYS